MGNAVRHVGACALACLATALCALSSSTLAADTASLDALRARTEALAVPLQTRQDNTRRALAACQAATPTRDCAGLAAEVPQLVVLAADRTALAARLAAAIGRCREARPVETETSCDTASLGAEVTWLETAVQGGAGPVLAGAAATPATMASAKAEVEKADAAVSMATADLLKRLKGGTGANNAPQATGAPDAVKLIDTAGNVAKAASKAAEAMKTHSEALVLRALALGRCTRNADGSAQCALGEDWESLVALGQQSLRELGRQQLALTKAVRETRELAWQARTSDEPMWRQMRARRFLELLEDSTDAATLAGQDAATLTATTAGSTASLRYSFDRRGSDSLNRFNIIVSTPLDTEKARTTLWRRSADGLAGRPKVELSYTRVALSLGDRLGFFAPGLSFSSARQELEYVDRADLSKLRTDRSSPASLGGHVIFSRNADGAQLFSLRVERQRRATPSDNTVTLCPPTPISGSSVLDCLTGGDGAPVRRYETVTKLGYQRQSVGPHVDLGLAIEHNARTDKTSIDLPLYLVRSGTDSDKGKRNAGISLSWASKGGGWAIGVFVGTPFSLSSLNGAP